MPPTTDPLRLQVIDRIVKVLQDIVPGDDYWAERQPLVFKRYVTEKDQVTFPVYGVFQGPGEPIEEINGEYAETFEVVVKGVVKSFEDIAEAIEHSLEDARTAIDADARSGEPGTLGAMTVFVRLGASETDEGENSAVGLGHFLQRFIVQIVGDPFGA